MLLSLSRISVSYSQPGNFTFYLHKLKFVLLSVQETVPRSLHCSCLCSRPHTENILQGSYAYACASHLGILRQSVSGGIFYYHNDLSRKLQGT